MSTARLPGVVMQANTGSRAENQGYFVPPSVIKHVMDDAKDGHHDGFPELGFRTQKLDSPAMKAAYGLQAGETGALVAKVFKDSPAAGKIQTNDVIMKIDGFEIASDRSIKFRPDLRTNYKYAVDQYHPGGQASA